MGHDHAVSVLIDYLSQDIDRRTGVLLLVEESLSYVSKVLGTGFFISFYDPGLGGKNIQNYFGMVTPKLGSGLINRANSSMLQRS
jgi:hypothetical protein